MEKLNRLKEVLEEQGRSQSWLAKKLDVSSNAINSLCSNRSQPSLKRLNEIAKILNTNVCSLIEPLELPNDSTNKD